MNYAILFGLISMLGFGLSGALAKTPSDNVSPTKFIFYRGIFTSIVTALIALVVIDNINFSVPYILATLGISLFGYISLSSFYKGMGKGKVGLISPIANSSVIYTVLLSLIFFNENLNQLQLLAFIIIVGGVILATLNPRDLKNSDFMNPSSGVPFALLTSLLWGFVFFILRIPVNVIGPILTSLVLEVGQTILSATHLQVSGQGFGKPEQKDLIYILLIGVLSAIAAIAFNMGIEKYDVSLVATINASNPIIPILYGRIVRKEDIKPRQYFAIGMILIGIIVISM